MRQSNQNSFSKAANRSSKPDETKGKNTFSFGAKIQTSKDDKTPRIEATRVQRIVPKQAVNHEELYQNNVIKNIDSGGKKKDEDNLISDGNTSLTNSGIKESMMKILKFEKLFKNEEGPRVSARNTGLAEGPREAKRQQLTSVSNLQSRKKIMSSTSRVQKKINYNSNMHNIQDEPIYDSIQQNLVKKQMNIDQRSRQSNFVNSESKKVTNSQAQGFTFEKPREINKTSNLSSTLRKNEIDQSAFFGAGNTNLPRQKNDIFKIQVVDPLNSSNQKTLFKKSRPSMQLEQKSVIQETIVNLNSSEEEDTQGLKLEQLTIQQQQSQKKFMDFAQEGSNQVIPYHKMIQKAHQAKKNALRNQAFTSGSHTQRNHLISNDIEFNSVQSQLTGRNFHSNFDSKNCKKELEKNKPIIPQDEEEFGESANSSPTSKKSADGMGDNHEQEKLVREYLELQGRLKNLKENNQNVGDCQNERYRDEVEEDEMVLLQQSSNSRVGDTLMTQIDPNILQNDFKYEEMIDTQQNSLHNINQQEQEFQLSVRGMAKSQNSKMATQKQRVKNSHRNREGVTKMMSMDRGQPSLKSKVPIHKKGAASFGGENRSLASMNLVKKKAHVQQIKFEASSSFNKLAQQTMSPRSFTNLNSYKKFEHTQQFKKSFVSQKKAAKGKLRKSWNQNYPQQQSSSEEEESNDREGQYIASASSNNHQNLGNSENSDSSDPMEISESSQQDEIIDHKNSKQRKTKAQRKQISRNRNKSANQKMSIQREKEQKKLQAYQEQILNLQKQLIKLQNKTLLPEPNFNQSILSQNQFNRTGTVSPLMMSQPLQYNQQFMTPQQNYRAQVNFPPQPSQQDLQQQHLIAQLQAQILDQQQQIEKIQRLSQMRFTETPLNQQQHVSMQQEQQYQQSSQIYGDQKQPSEGGGVVWGSQSQNQGDQTPPLQRSNYVDASAKEAQNIQMRSYDISNNFMNTDSTPINVGTIESPENIDQQASYNEVDDFMVPERDTNNTKNNILNQYHIQKQISQSKKERKDSLLNLQKAKQGYPSMLDSGVYGMNVPKSLVTTEQANNHSQLVSDNDSQNQLEDDNNFDTMINPDIKISQRKKESPQRAKQEVLIIGFDSKPKGKNPLLRKQSPERYPRDDTSNLTGFEIGRTGPIINKSIKSEISSRARWDQKFKSKVFKNAINNDNQVVLQEVNINQQDSVLNTIQSPKIMNTSESHKQISNSIINIPNTKDNHLESTPKQRPFQTNEVQDSPDMKFGNWLKDNQGSLESQRKQKIDETLNKSQDVIFNKDSYFDQKTERLQKTRGDLLVIGDDIPNLQEVFLQKKSAQIMQKIAERNIKRSDFAGINQRSPRGQTPNQSPRQNRQEDSFNIEIGDNKSTTTYGPTKVVRKAKTKEELAELRKQMMRKKFKANQAKKSEFTLGDVADAKAVSQMDTTSHNAFSAIGFKQNQDTISYINMQTSTFGDGKQMIIPSTDRQGQKTEKKSNPKLQPQSRTQSQNKVVWETQSKIDDDLLSRLASGQKVHVDKKSSRQLTKKNFDKLPENRKKAEDQKRLEESKILKQKQALYQKELDQRLRQSFLNKKKRSRLKSQQSINDAQSNIDSRHMAAMLQQQIEQTQGKSRGDFPDRSQTNVTGIIHKSRIETILASKSQGVLSPKSNNILSKKMSNILNNDGLDAMSNQANPHQQSPNPMMALSSSQKKLKKHRNSSQSNQLTKIRNVSSKQSIELLEQSSQISRTNKVKTQYNSLQKKQTQVAQATINLQRR